MTTNENKLSVSKAKKKVVLEVSLSDEDPLRVKVKLTTKWKKIMKSFADYKGRNPDILKYLYDGHRIQEYQTVGDVIDVDGLDGDDEEEGIKIDVMIEQLGGH